MQPFVKWVGGKRQLLPEIKKYLPKKYNTYYEAFVGGGALFFDLAPQKAVINDLNFELITTYECFKDKIEFNHLKEELSKFDYYHSESFYYRMRDDDEFKDLKSLCKYKIASRFIYLNKAGFNGLYRVNKKGAFNVPFGKKTTLKTFENDNFTDIYEFMNKSEITILNTDFEKAVATAKKGDFVYFDPPYSETHEGKTAFTSYTKNGFTDNDQKRLATCVKNLTSKGVFVMISNHDNSFIRELYKDTCFKIHTVKAKRNVNSKGDGRGLVPELIVTNY